VKRRATSSLPSSPAKKEATEENHLLLLPSVRVLDSDVRYRFEHGGQLYLQLSAVSKFLSAEDSMVPRLKRRARSLEGERLRFPFFPSYFKRGAEQESRNSIHLSTDIIIAVSM
jgi:hypothetical protein